MSDVRIRGVPGFENYYAGDDGCLYRRYEGHVNPSSPKRYCNITQNGVTERHQLGWYIARAWCEGYDDSKRMLPRYKDGNCENTRPENLEWEEVEKKPPRQAAREREERVRRQMESDPADPRHGTRTGYRYRCGCERCRAMGPLVNRRKQIKKTLREGGMA